MYLREIVSGGRDWSHLAQDVDQWRALANIVINVGFEVFTAVVMKSIAFWDIMPSSPLKVKRRFGGTYRLHFQGRISRENISVKAGGLSFNRLHGVISQKMVLFMVMKHRIP
jgi:hypothetical protein